jgi:hypothetical protein
MANLATQIINIAHLGGLASGAYIGFTQSENLKNMLYSKVPQTRIMMDKYIPSEKAQSRAFMIATTLTGVYIGYHMFPLSIAAAIILNSSDS